MKHFDCNYMRLIRLIRTIILKFKIYEYKDNNEGNNKDNNKEDKVNI